MTGRRDEQDYGSPASIFQRAGGLAATGNLKGAFSEVAGSFGLVGIAASKLIDVTVALPGMLKGWADSAAQLTGVFSPLTSGLYTRAWRDLTASIGEQLMPVVQTATSVVRFLGDTIAGLTPIIRPLITEVLGAFKPIFTTIGQTFREIINAGVILYETVKPLASTVFQLVSPLGLINALLKSFTDDLKNLNAQVALFLGIDLPKFDGASLGKAFVSVQTQSVSSMLQQVRQEAFKIGPSAKEDPAKKQVDILAAILKKLGEFTPASFATAVATAMLPTIAGIPGELIAGLPKKLADVIGQAIADALAGKFPGAPGVPQLPQLPNLPFFPPAPAPQPAPQPGQPAPPAPAPNKPFDPFDFAKKQFDKNARDALDKLPQGWRFQ